MTDYTERRERINDKARLIDSMIANVRLFKAPQPHKESIRRFLASWAEEYAAAYNANEARHERETAAHNAPITAN